MFFLKIETQKYELGHMFFPHPYYKGIGMICQLLGFWKVGLNLWWFYRDFFEMKWGFLFGEVFE